MKKWLVGAMLAGMTFSMLTGCGKEEEPERSFLTEDEEEEETEKEETENTVDQGREEREAQQETSVEELLQQFVDGEIRAVIAEDYLGDEGYVMTGFRAGEAYTLEEIQEMLYSDDNMPDGSAAEVYSISYGKFEGTGERGCLRIQFESQLGYGTDYIMVCSRNGRLEITMTAEEIYRSYASVNDYGVVSTGGSSGAASYVQYVYAPNMEDGSYQEAYMLYTQIPGWSFYEGDNTDLPVNELLSYFTEENGYENYWYLTVLQLEIEGNYCYGVSCEDAELLSEFMEKAEDMNLEILTEEEIQNLQSERMNELGLSEREAYSEKYVTWSYENDLSAESEWGTAYGEFRVYTDAYADAYTALDGAEVVEYENDDPDDLNGVIRIVCDEDTYFCLERGEWVNAAGSEMDFFLEKEILVGFNANAGEAYEIQVHMTEGIPDMRLHAYNKGCEAVWYCMPDMRGEDEGIFTVAYNGIEDLELTEEDPIIPAAAVYAGMVVNAGDTREINSGSYYWMTLGSALYAVLADSEWETDDGLMLPYWLVNSYAMVLGMEAPDLVGIGENDPVQYIDDDWYLFEEQSHYVNGEVEVLDITKEDDGTYTVDYIIHGQYDELVVVKLCGFYDVNLPFHWLLQDAVMAKG